MIFNISESIEASSGGVDVVVFSFEWNSNYTIVSSSCNKTFAECFNMVDGGNGTALAHHMWDVDLSPWDSDASANMKNYGDTYITYVCFSGVVPWADITYHSNGQIDFSEPSAYGSNLTAESNGYYGMANGGVYIDATVSVPAGEVVWANWNGDVAAYNSSGTPQATDLSIAIPTAGTYKIKSIVRNTYTSSFRSCHVRFYKNNTAVGTQHTVPPSTFSAVEETITCAAGDVITLYCCSANSTYTAACNGLFVCPVQ